MDGGCCSGSPEHPTGTMSIEGDLKVPLGFVCFKQGACKRAVTAKGACGEGLWDQRASAFDACVLLGRKAVSWDEVSGQGPALAFANGPQPGQLCRGVFSATRHVGSRFPTLLSGVRGYVLPR